MYYNGAFTPTGFKKYYLSTDSAIKFWDDQLAPSSNKKSANIERKQQADQIIQQRNLSKKPWNGKAKPFFSFYRKDKYHWTNRKF